MGKYGKSWGPYTWYLLHMLSLTWEKKYIKYYIDFFKLIAKTIPCYICSINFKNKILYPRYSIKKNCSSKEIMIEWLINLHNSVNIKYNQKIYTINEVMKLYVKNKMLYFNNTNIIKFIIEYIGYNIKINRKHSAIKLLYILAYIYPNPKKRLHLIYFIKNHKSKSIPKFLSNYINIIK